MIDHESKDPDPTYTTQMSHDQESFDVGAFDALARSQGMQFVHYRAIGCPIGMQDLHDSRRAHDDHSGCNGGFLYKRVGLVTMATTSNSGSERRDPQGTYDSSTFQVTVPISYDDLPEFPYLAYHDRLYLNEDQIVVPQWEKVRASATGRDKLRFPPVEVRILIDNQGREYTQGREFDLEDGGIVWTGQDRPAPGAVYSVWILYRPFWYVQRLSKEIRVSQSLGIDGRRVVQRMPQSIVLQREFVFEVADQDPEARGNDLRQAAAAVVALPPVLNPAAPFGR